MCRTERRVQMLGTSSCSDTFRSACQEAALPVGALAPVVVRTETYGLDNNNRRTSLPPRIRVPN